MFPPTLDSSLPTVAEADLPLVAGGLSLDFRDRRYVAASTFSDCVDDATDRHNARVSRSVNHAVRTGGRSVDVTRLKNGSFDRYVGELRGCLAAYKRPAP